MSGRRVDQFHSGTAIGDAVTQQLFFLRGELRALGYQSDIYAEHIAPQLAGDVLDIREYTGAASDVLLVHHSIGHTAFDRILAAPSQLITVFHNITPERFFDDASTRYYIRLGRQQLRKLATRSVSGIAVSNHNREEMYDAGFTAVDVLPVRTDFAAPRGRRSAQHSSREWLFVGRIAPHKHQLEVVRAFAAYHHAFDRAATLTLIGDTSMIDYADLVADEAKRLNVRHLVHLAGKVSDDELWAAYERAGLFVCLSEHEGFGVPLLEAMAAGVPVIARAEAAVPETMGGAGVLVEGLDPWTIAAAAQLLSADGTIRRRLIEQQDERLARIEAFDVPGLLAKVLDGTVPGRRRPSLQLQGPFETSYSLAATNRALVTGLARTGSFDVSIYATEGPGDYTPAASDLAAHPEATALYEARHSAPFPDVVIRQMFPPRVDDSPGGMTFQYFAWEESRVPQEYVENFNRHLDGIGVTSRYVADVLRDSGVVVPITVVRNGVVEPPHGSTAEIEELRELRGFRFLHISSAFPRKGVDLLLGAYFDAFSGEDDVTLVLKTHPNPHNEVGTQLAALRAAHANPPDVRWIDRDLTPEQVGGLYWLADSYVHPARGEGFGLPVAEAMLAEVPVISVAATGLADFVSDETATTIPFTTAPARTHLGLADSTWIEPDRDALVKALRDAFDGSDAERRQARVAAAKQLIESEFSWDAAVGRWTSFIAERRRLRPGIKVAMVTTWNSRCGIAEYTRSLVDGMGSYVDLEAYCDQGVIPLDELVEESSFRTWYQSLEDTPTELREALARSSADLVHIQYNFGFFNARELSSLIEHESATRPVVVTLHRTADLQTPDRLLTLREAVPGLRKAARVIVHQRADLEFLASIGVSDNVSLIPIGCEPPCGLDKQEMRALHDVDPRAKVVGTFGFLLPHKGTIDLIRALPALRANGDDVRLIAVSALHPDPSSAAYRDQCLAEVRRLRLEPYVSLKTEYLDEQVAQELLSACDVIALPYGQTGESSSAALRSVLPIGRPIVVSDVPIFDDAREALAHVPAPVAPEALAERLREILDSHPAAEALGRAAEQFCRRNSWLRTSAATRELYGELISAARGSDGRQRARRAR